MAFATKYQLEFKDYEDNTWYVYFQEDGFSGDITEFTPGGDPLHIHWNASDKYQTIVGSFCDIQMVYESACDDLYTEESNAIRVLIYKAADIKWYGFLSPGQYYRQFNQPVNYVTFTASDGLGELKGIKFKDGDDPYFYQQTELSAVSDILTKTGLSLLIYESINIYESDYTSTSIGSPLAQTFFYPEMYWDEVTDDSQNCYVVLQDILKKYGARIYQWQGTWCIFRTNACNTDSVTERRYTAAGTYNSYDNIAPYTNISDEDMVYLNGDAELNRIMSVGSTEITAAPPIRQNALKNGTFRDFTWNGANPYYWTNSSATYAYSSTYDCIAILNNELSTIPTEYISCVVDLYKPTGIRLSGSFMAVYTGSPLNHAVYISIEWGGYYLGTNGTWSSSTAYWNYTPSSTMSDFEQFTIDGGLGPYGFGGYGDYGDLNIRLYEFRCETIGAGNQVYFKDLVLEVDYNESAPQTKIYTFDGPNSVNNIKTDELTLCDSIVPAYVTTPNDDMFFGITTDAVGRGNTTYDWYIKGDGPTVATPIPIAELLAKQITEGYHKSLDTINAIFRGGLAYKGPHEAIQDDNFLDDYGFNKTFIPVTLDWDIYRINWSGQWVECPVVYTDEELEWDSHDCGGDAVITGDSIEVNNWTSTGGDFAYFDDYTAVAGETIRVVFPYLTIDGDAQGRTWGVNYYTYTFASAGTYNIRMGVAVGYNINLTAVVELYSLTGI